MTYVECNVGDRASVDAAIATCAEHGRIDVLANVAGVVQFGRFETITDAEWDRVHTIDLKGPFMLMQAAMPHIRACRGNIVNVSSVAGRVPQPYTTAYSAAKGGLTMLTRALALELSPEGIRVNAICPGTVDTPIVSEVFEKLTDDLDTRVADRLMMMLSGTISPGEIAAAIRYLASPEAIRHRRGAARRRRHGLRPERLGPTRAGHPSRTLRRERAAMSQKTVRLVAIVIVVVLALALAIGLFGSSIQS